MKVLLVRPHINKKITTVKKFMFGEPMGIECVSTILKEQGHHVLLVDFMAESHRNLKKYINKEIEVLFEQEENGEFKGHTTNYMVINGLFFNVFSYALYLICEKFINNKEIFQILLIFRYDEEIRSLIELNAEYGNKDRINCFTSSL